MSAVLSPPSSLLPRRVGLELDAEVGAVARVDEYLVAPRTGARGGVRGRREKSEDEHDGVQQ